MIYLTAFYLLLCVVFNPLCIMCEKWHLLAEIDIQYYVHGNAAEKKALLNKKLKNNNKLSVYLCVCAVHSYMRQSKYSRLCIARRKTNIFIDLLCDNCYGSGSIESRNPKRSCKFSDHLFFSEKLFRSGVVKTGRVNWFRLIDHYEIKKWPSFAITITFYIF